MVFMPDEAGDELANDPLMQRQWRDWQRWSLLVLGVGLIGAALALYAVLSHGEGSSAQKLLPAIIYGAVALLVLGNFYLVQREAVLKGVQNELVRQRIEAELNRELSLMDPVTEVYNRRYARVILRREASRAKRYNMGLSVLLIDITGFRRVNESLGQAGGDMVLRQVAHVLQTKIRNSDIIVRFGGDEFLLVLTDSEPKGVEQLSDRLRRSLHEWTQTSGLTEFNLEFAMGLAHYTDELRVDELLNLAEHRMVNDRSKAANTRA